MKRIIFITAYLFICFTSGAQDVTKDKIVASVYAILMDAPNNFTNFRGINLNTDTDGNITCKIKKPVFANGNLFSQTIKYWKKTNNSWLTLESDDEAGENNFRTVELALDLLADKNIFIKRESTLGATTVIKYVDSSYNEIASLWYKSSLRYMIYFKSGTSIQYQLQKYLASKKNSTQSREPVAKKNYTEAREPSVKANENMTAIVLLNDYFLFYQNLTNTSDLGFDWIFDTRDPAALEIKLTYINILSSIRNQLPYSITDDLYDATTIISIDGIPTAKMTRQQAVDLLKGTPGTNCTIGLKFKTAAKDELHTIVLKRESGSGILAEQEHYAKGIENFKKGQFEKAISDFKLIQYYPEAQIMLWKIYSGRILDEISFANNGILLKGQLKRYFNQDSLSKYSFPTSSNPQLLELKALYCNEYKFNTAGITSAKNSLNKLAADKGDVFSQEYMVRLHTSHYDTDASFISKNILPDKEQAWYWYKRAVAGGSKTGPQMLSNINKMKTEKDVYGVNFNGYVFDFKDAKAVSTVAHMQNGLTKILPPGICPFGVKGFESGILLHTSRGIGFKWTTHVMQDYAFANKHYEYALQSFMDNFPRYDFKDIQWMNVQVNDRYLKAKVAHFTATETDGKNYIMSMSIVLEKVSTGYQIVLEYKDIDKITKAVIVPKVEIDEDDWDDDND